MAAQLACLYLPLVFLFLMLRQKSARIIGLAVIDVDLFRPYKIYDVRFRTAI